MSAYSHERTLKSRRSTTLAAHCTLHLQSKCSGRISVVEKTTPITGGCLCGAVRYEVSELLREAGPCHCRVCQKTTGSAFAAIGAVPLTAFRLTKGQPKQYRSSSIMEKCFCANCGSRLFDRYLVPVRARCNPDNVWIHIGTLDEPEAVTIEAHSGVESQLPWVQFDDGLPRWRCDEDPALVAAFAAAEAGEE
jgi:hypothetical protein